MNSIKNIIINHSGMPFFLGFQGYGQSETTTVKGVVTDDIGMPLPGATVSFKRNYERHSV